MTTKQAIEQVLSRSRKPMSVTQIAEAALPLTNLKGKQPKQAFYSVLYGENKKPDGLVVRVEAGQFKLNPNRKKANGKATPAAEPAKPARKRSATKDPVAEAVEQDAEAHAATDTAA